MNILLKINRPASIEYLHPLIDTIFDCAKKVGMSEKRINELCVAVEEVLTNIFNYAYEGKAGDVEVVCKSDPGKTFVVEIIDRGVPFDPFSAREPDMTEDISERNTGGLGIYLIKKLMDNFRYRREGDKNIQELTVYL
ncbi:MAG: ATP-binding protein [Syntrophorhabdaceae bacterium]|nr:ATP-binding protein [Syntrophorhabdaceae bacterium]